METLNKTWFVDIDGTFLKHNTDIGLDDLIKEEDSHLREIPIPNSIKFLRGLPKHDKIIITTARQTHHREHTVKALKHLGVRYDDILFNLTSGPRILINDIKPPGVVNNVESIVTAYAVNLNRNEGISSDTQHICNE
tara:strand:+ start:2371 stop:2781 length:411 start_codon:yes stop_codon:yes gene_type:complete